MPPITFPRTVAEFTAAGRRVAVTCGRCGAIRLEAPESLALAFGTDFDLYAGLREVQARLFCAACGEGKPTVSFVDPLRPSFGPVSFEDATRSAMELSAYAAAGDEALPLKGTAFRRRRR